MFVGVVHFAKDAELVAFDTLSPFNVMVWLALLDEIGCRAGNALYLSTTTDPFVQAVGIADRELKFAASKLLLVRGKELTDKVIETRP